MRRRDVKVGGLSIKDDRDCITQYNSGPTHLKYIALISGFQAQPPEHHLSFQSKPSLEQVVISKIKFCNELPVAATLFSNFK